MWLLQQNEYGSFHINNLRSGDAWSLQYLMKNLLHVLYSETCLERPLPWKTICLKGPHILGRRSHISMLLNLFWRNILHTESVVLEKVPKFSAENSGTVTWHQRPLVTIPWRRQRDSANSGTFSNTTDSVCRIFSSEIMFPESKNIHSQKVTKPVTKRPPVLLKNHIFMANRTVFQDKFYCTWYIFLIFLFGVITKMTLNTPAPPPPIPSPKKEKKYAQPMDRTRPAEWKSCYWNPSFLLPLALLKAILLCKFQAL